MFVRVCARVILSVNTIVKKVIPKICRGVKWGHFKNPLKSG